MAPPLEESPARFSRADEMHAAGEYEALYALLEQEASAAPAADDVELLWRRARARYELSEQAADDAARREELIRSGIELADAAVAVGASSGYAHKWAGILLGKLSDFVSTKEKVANSFTVRRSLERAAELLPADASVQHALGDWCAKVAKISFIERKIASALFGEPPQASVDDALRYYTAAFELRPTAKVARKAAALADNKMADGGALAASWTARAAECDN